VQKNKETPKLSLKSVCVWGGSQKPTLCCGDFVNPLPDFPAAGGEGNPRGTRFPRQESQEFLAAALGTAPGCRLHLPHVSCRLPGFPPPHAAALSPTAALVPQQVRGGAARRCPARGWVPPAPGLP